MKRLTPHVFDRHKCRQEWNEFDQHLKKYSVLDENKHVLPFFKVRHDLSCSSRNTFRERQTPTYLRTSIRCMATLKRTSLWAIPPHTTIC